MSVAEPSRGAQPWQDVTGASPSASAATNPVGRLLARRFHDRLGRLLDQVAAETPTARVAAAGCADGGIVARLRDRWGAATAVALHDPAHAPLDLGDKAVDVLVVGAGLGTLPDPAAGLRELARVTRRHLVLAVPRAPLSRLAHLVAGPRATDVARGWSSPDLIRLVSTVGAVADVAKPLPWTIVWVRLD